MFKQRQEDELEVIKAIYFEEVKEIHSSKGQTKLSMLLGPQQGCSIEQNHQETHVLLCLFIPAKYPNNVPKILLEDVKGISELEVKDLKKELEEKAEMSIGKEMILELAQFTQNFLYAHKKKLTGSFYDEMLIRNQLQKEDTKRKERAFQEQEVMGIKHEIEKKRQLLIEEARFRKEELKMYSNEAEASSEAKLGSSPAKEIFIAKPRATSLRGSGGDSDTATEASRKLIEIPMGKQINAFQLGEVLGSSASGYRVYAAMENQTGNLVVVMEWLLNYTRRERAKKLFPSESNSYDDAVKQLSSMESEMKVLQRLAHTNIVTSLGMSVIKSKFTITVYCAQEFIRGMTLQSYFDGTLTMDIPFIRHCAIGITKALAFLHSNNIVHRFLRDTSVFIDTKGELKITDYALDRKLDELLRLTNGCAVLSDPFAPSVGRGAKKCDIYRLGILLLSLLNGERVTQNPPEISSALPAEIRDFLRKCMDTNENSRWNAQQLLEHSFLKLRLEKGKDMLGLNSGNRDHFPEEDEKQNELIQELLSHSVRGHSRLREEFEIMIFIGKGGFGDVLKVQNKLDGGIYALKRIRLNPRNKQLNKKITREVKLLSRLNHENVVRYYNSWIETVVDNACDSDSTSYTTTPTQSKVKFRSELIQNSLGLPDNVEELAPQVLSQSSNWGSEVADDDELESNSSDEDDLFGTSFLRVNNDESENIVFDGSSSTSKSLSESQEEQKTSSERSSLRQDKLGQRGIHSRADGDIRTESQFMYIQMEFCEKSTLRTAIDADLHKDTDRAWRLFREVVEGLAHIHQQGMIHRDLKPVNIFLDSGDHVKIGDFGLATTNMIFKNPTGEILFTPHTPTPYLRPNPSNDTTMDESLTSNVGTALYVAPELVSKSLHGSKVMYSQKVDIYSLGVVFFEMIYPPIDTGMERIRVITGIRQRDIQFPMDFDTVVMQKEISLLKWLLNHDPRQRPTSQELLQSEYLPPPQMQETELQEMFRHTLSNSHSKAYKYLISSCFQQNVSAADELTFDMDILKSSHPENHHFRFLTMIQYVKETVKKICLVHGAVEVNMPILIPKLPLYESTSSQVKLMTHSGNVVGLHHDLRVPFARYAVSNGLTNVKRFAIEKVFRERKVFGFHPREFYECAFDIISTGKGSLLPEVETLSVAFEIFQELPWMRNKVFTLRIGHTSLLEAVMMHFAIDETYHQEIKLLLTDVKSEKQAKSLLQTRLMSLCLPDQFISMLFTLMDLDGPLSKVSNVLKSIVKRNGPAASLIKEGLHELQVLIDLVEAFGLQCIVVVSPTITFGNNVYSGLIYQISCQMKKKRNRVSEDTLALGGKYDTLLRNMRTTRETAGVTPVREIEQSGVGLSISLDLLIIGYQNEDFKETGYRLVDVILCSLGHHLRIKEKIEMLKKLWSHGISSIALDDSQNLETAEEHCLELGASVIVLLKEETFNSSLRIRYVEKQRFLEKKINMSELIEFIMSRIATSPCIGLKTTESQRSITQTIDSHVPAHQGPNASGINVTLVTSESKDKTANWKRRQENMMIGHISESLKRISKQQVVEVLGVDVNREVIKILVSELDVTDKDNFNKAVYDVLDRHPRQRKLLKVICDDIYDLIFVKGSEIIVIYSLIDNFYKTLL